MEPTSFASCPQAATDARSDPVWQLPIIVDAVQRDVRLEAGGKLTNAVRQSERGRTIDRRSDDRLGGAQAELADCQRQDDREADRR